MKRAPIPSRGFLPVIEVGYTANGCVKVSIETESDGRIFVNIGGAQLQMPAMGWAMTAALGWCSGHLHNVACPIDFTKGGAA